MAGPMETLENLLAAIAELRVELDHALLEAPACDARSPGPRPGPDAPAVAPEGPRQRLEALARHLDGRLRGGGPARAGSQGETT